MATLPIATFQTLTDSIAAQYKALRDAFGATGTAGTAQYGADQNRTRIAALNDVQQTIDLMVTANLAVDTLDRTKWLPGLFSGIINALRNHVGGNFDTYMAANDARVAPEFRDVAPAGWVATANVFPPVVDPIASYTVTGATTGTFTAGSAIDTTQYGKAAFEVAVTSNIGAGTVTATLTLTQADGSSTTRVVTITSGATAGSAFAVGSGSDRFVNCTAIAITGGTSGAFKVRSKLERTIAM